MKPKIAETVLREDWELYEHIRTIITALPEELTTHAFIFGLRMPRSMAESHLIPDCHTFARALSRFLPVDVHSGIITEIRPDGQERRHEHSWLTRKGSDGKVIIDPWPLGSVSGPALFVQAYGFHFANECDFLYHQTRKFKWGVAALRFAIRKVLKKEGAKLQAAT